MLSLTALAIVGALAHGEVCPGANNPSAPPPVETDDLARPPAFRPAAVFVSDWSAMPGCEGHASVVVELHIPDGAFGEAIHAHRVAAFGHADTLGSPEPRPSLESIVEGRVADPAAAKDALYDSQRSWLASQPPEVKDEAASLEAAAKRLLMAEVSVHGEPPPGLAVTPDSFVHWHVGPRFRDSVLLAGSWSSGFDAPVGHLYFPMPTATPPFDFRLEIRPRAPGGAVGDAVSIRFVRKPGERVQAQVLP